MDIRQRRHGGTNKAPARSLYRQILAAHSETDKNCKRTDKQILIELSSINLFHKMEKDAFEANTLEKEGVIGRTASSCEKR